MILRRSLPLRLLVLLALVAPVIAQNESKPYFSLSSTRSFGSRDKPEIQLSGFNVNAVQIRVYRVRDPIEFYRRLESVHGFGAIAPRPPGKQTLLETIHAWKRSLRAAIRRGLRGQFTESPSAHFHKAEPVKTTAGANPDYFAQAPLLNQDQLVLSFVQPVISRERWASARVPISVKDPGVYLIEAVSSGLRAYTILTVSDIVLLTKVGRERVLTFVADRSSGQPLSHVSISLMQRNGSPSAVRTNESGLADVPADLQKEGTRLVAVRDRDVAFGELPAYSFYARNNNWVGYVYTDRPVYRPGDTARFRSILRVAEIVGYSVPANRDVAVQVLDPNGKPVYQKTLATNTHGALHDALPLARDASLGYYYIQIKAGENTFSGVFEVQEYKKPEYEVRVTPGVPRVLQGETVTATIDARYYFGEPVENASVKYAIFRSRYWFPLWRNPGDDEDAGEEADQDEGGNGDQVSEGQGQLDSDGKLTIHFAAPVSEHKYDYRYRIEARVTDQARREISGSGFVLATYGSIVVNAAPERFFLEPSSLENFSVSARDYDSKPVSTTVRLQLLRWNWRDRKPSAVEGETTVHTGADGNAAAQLKLPAVGGSFRVKASARSPEGRDVESDTYIWVAGARENSFFAATRSLQIVPDKKSYRPGETAHILVLSGEDGAPVLASIEGRDVRSSKLIRSAAGSAVFDYNVSKGDEPGFFVSAQTISKGELYTGTKRVKVPPEDHKLNITLSTDKPQYLPGQTASYKLSVTTPEGKPVEKADLSLGVVDEAIYAIRPDRTPDILDFFYGNSWNSVYTDSSLQFYFTGEAGTRRMELAQLRPASQLAQLKPERLVQPKIRKAFPDTAFWDADVTTDAQGEAHAAVPFPDSLTTWRATARGSATGERFGSAQLKTIVRKNVILRLSAPRFFIQGDQVTVSSIVHNYLTTAKHARLTISTRGVTLYGANTQEIDVPSRADARVDWRVKADPAVKATLTAQALTDEESDAVEIELPVHPPGVRLRQPRSGSLSNSSETAFSFSFPPEAQAASRSLAIRVSPSIAGSLFGALDYLTSFPYGCVEQTMSSFLPDLMVSRAFNELHLQQPLDRAALADKINSGLERLYSFQHSDGGWGWWESDESQPFMTAYVAAGLAEARNGGIAIKPASLNRGLAWLRKHQPPANSETPDLAAYMQYALAVAGSASSDQLSALYNDRSRLSSYGAALLGLALESAKDSRAAGLAQSLAAAAQQNEAEAWWPSSRDPMLDFTADTTPETTAYAVKLLSHQQPQSPLLPKAALWLVNHRNEGFWWSSTKQTATVIYGLLDYLKASNELHPDISVQVVVNGKPLVEQSFTSASAPDAELNLDDTRLERGANQIRIVTKGQGRAYWAAEAAHYSNQPHEEKQGAISLNVLRDYFRLVPAHDGGKIVYDLAPLAGPAASGDTLAVRLTVTGSDWKYLLAEDPIPAGTEFIDRDNSYILRNRPPWWTYLFTRRELHDDHMALFTTDFREGQQQYFYLLKVIHPGVFQASPARVGPMYQPSVRATTEAKTLEVSP